MYCIVNEKDKIPLEIIQPEEPNKKRYCKVTIWMESNYSTLRGGHRVMRFEMYMRDGEIGEIWVNKFDQFHNFLLSVQCTQTQVVLFKEKTQEKEKKERSTHMELIIQQQQQRKTDLYGSPSDKANARLLVLEGNAPAKRDESRRLEVYYAVACALYQLKRLRCRLRLGIHLPVCRLVIVDFGRGRLNRVQWVPQEAYVDFEYRLGHQRVAFLDDGGVGWIGLEGSDVLL